MDIGFTVIGQGTEIEARLYTPSPEQCTSLVAFSQQDTFFALLMGAIYYQHDLLVRLEPCCAAALRKECSTNAATLALAVYRYLGPAALASLEGDFALVIWDAERRSFVAMRDPLGGYPLYWTEYGGMVALSTSLWSLLALRPQSVLNEEYFAELIMQPLPRQEGASELCAYVGIQRVLPGSMVTLGIAPIKAESQLYWRWLAHIHDPGTSDVVALAEQYKPLLAAAIRERLRGRTCSHFSGGMDSTAIALMARDELCSGGGKAPLHALSLVYKRLPMLARETAYIEEALQCGPEIVAHRLSADDLLDFDSFLDAPPHEEPFAGLRGLAKDRAMVDRAFCIGATTMLTGLGADEIHDLHPFYLADLLLQGRICQAWREACKWAQGRNCNPWAILLPFGLATLPPIWFISNLVKRRQKSAAVRLNQQSDWTVPPWILLDFVRRYALWDRAIENAQHMYRLCQRTDLSVTLNAIENRAGDVLRWSVAAPRGIAIAHPFLDRRLLCFGLGMQLRLQPEPGQMKPVLAEAMRDILPECICHRRRKGHFDEVYYRGLSRNLQHLEAMVRQMPSALLKMFDQDMLLKYLQEARIAGANVRQLQRMDSVLAIIHWFCLESQWRQVRTAPTQVVHVC